VLTRQEHNLHRKEENVITKIPASVVLETVTPELAEHYLERNANNYRRLDEKTVRRYARDMTKGAWQDRHPQGIAFDWFGVLGGA
jgi:hypothetical protein